MRRIAETLLAWEAAGTPYALATVVRTWASAPLGPGSAMAVSATGEVVGSVSGGCVEAAVYDLAIEVLRTGRSVRETYGVTDGQAQAVGLVCGGQVEILVEPVDPDEGRGRRAAEAAEAERPLMLVFGVSDFAVALTSVATGLGYRVVVCDARATFARRERFPDAAEVVVDWPHRYLERAPVDGRTAVCVLTHDPKFDVPVLAAALAGPARYVGAMGSRRSHEERLVALRAAGVTEEQLSRLSSPIGLDLGAVTPEETAIAIAAEIVMLARGGTPARLTQTREAIHR